MTDRHAGYVVTLASNIREDDAADIVTALKQIRGVLDVRPVISNGEFMVAEVRARRDLQEKLYAVYCSMFEWETSKAGSR